MFSEPFTSLKYSTLFAVEDNYLYCTLIRSKFSILVQFYLEILRMSNSFFLITTLGKSCHVIAISLQRNHVTVTRFCLAVSEIVLI